MGLVLLIALAAVVFSALWKKVWMELIWRPYTIARDFRKQGVTGPPYKFWRGSLDELKSIESSARSIVLDKNSHDITIKVLARYRKWTKEYGGTFLYWIGTRPRICITDPEMIKQVLTDESDSYLKGEANSDFFALLGKGLFLVDGEDWARHRKVIVPVYAKDKVKLMTTDIVESTKVILQRWHNETICGDEQEKELEVLKEFNELAADVIARTAFGSTYNEQKELFIAHQKLLVAVVKTAFRQKIPGFKYLPTKINRYKWHLQRELRKGIMRIIQKRLDTKEGEYGNDLLGTLIESTRNEGNQMLSMEEIINECKTFFMAGYRTIADLLAWAMFLLSANQDWQERVREEVLREYAMEVPSADALNKLKLVKMVLLETLRLYSPVFIFGRKTNKNVELGNLKVPKGTGVAIPVLIVHRMEEIWGPDANEFNPSRFENGVVGATKHPTAFLAFDSGIRKCIGQNFALLEATIVIAMILQRFKFSLSPSYKHSPEMFLTLKPKYGVPVVFKPLHV